ncbi:MAG: hypothetical protein IPG93_10935 [Burkholderiales bacterium]|nr:hypothetical protein [Burkholderiales bacterium]
MGFWLAACHPCARRMDLSPVFRRRAYDLAKNRGLRVLYQRAADLVGITGAALLGAMPGPLAMPDRGRLRAADVRLSLPIGSLETAVAHVLGQGSRQ